MRRLVVVGSAVTAALSLVVGGVAGAVLTVGAPAPAPAAGSWRPAATAMPLHLDEPAPGVDVRARPSTASLLEGLGDARRLPTGADLLRAAGRRATSAAVASATVSPRPPGAAVLGGLGSHVPPSCSGTTDGNRVQVLYVREAATPSRYADLLPALRSYVADVDDTFALSSDAGGRRVRWVQDAACVPVVPEVVVADGTLTRSPVTALISALAAQGLKRPDRKYLALADAATLCGVAETYQDDSPGRGNDNNGGVAMYGRVDSACWAARAGYHSAPAHELMHMLGAVQPSAPHQTRYGHCTDESDALCYDDGSGQAMVATCTAPGAEALYDCNHDDYFDPGPAPTGYLARAWNTASSSFLDVVPALRAGPATAPTPPAPAPTPVPAAALTVTLRAPATAYVGADLTVTATATAAAGPTPATSVVLQTTSATGAWRAVATAPATAGSARFVLRAGAAGRVALRAVVPASATVLTARSAVVTVQVQRVPTSLTATARSGRPAVLRTRVVAGGRAVAGEQVTLQQRVGGTVWRTVVRRVTDRAGAVSAQVRPARPTSYRWVFGGTAVLAPAVSRTASAG